MKDRYERRHRATAAHPDAVRVMADADFSGPSLSAAMGLEGSEVAAYWRDEFSSYFVPGDEWASRDGDEWTGSDGQPVTSNAFAVARITLVGGPRDGEIVA